MPVFGSQGGKGQIIDEQVLMEQEVLKEAIKKGFLILADSYTSKDWMTALNLLIDAGQPARVRIKAAEMLGDIGELDVIDTFKSHTFGND